MNVSQFSILGNNSVCSDLLISSSGTLSCTVPNSFGNSSISIGIYKSGIRIGRTIINLNPNSSDIYGTSLFFIGFISLILIMSIGFIGSPIVASFVLILGVIVLTALNLFYTASWIGTGATVLWFIIAVVMIIIKGATNR